MKRTWMLFILGILSALFLSACGSATSSISDDDSRKIANYSSDVLAQHNTNSNSRLVEESEVKKEYQKQLDLNIKKQNFAAQQAAATESGSTSAGGTETVSGETAAPQMTLAEAVGAQGFDIQYKGYDVLASYPSEKSDDIYMGMSAAQGDKLLVLYFTISNTGTSDEECNILSQKPTFRVKINGEKNTVQQTILNNDLSTFDDTIPAGGAADAVLISEVKEDKLTDIQSLSLIVRSADGRPEYPLN